MPPAILSLSVSLIYGRSGGGVGGGGKRAAVRKGARIPYGRFSSAGGEQMGPSVTAWRAAFPGPCRDREGVGNRGRFRSGDYQWCSLAGLVHQVCVFSGRPRGVFSLAHIKGAAHKVTMYRTKLRFYIFLSLSKGRFSTSYLIVKS